MELGVLIGERAKDVTMEDDDQLLANKQLQHPYGGPWLHMYPCLSPRGGLRQVVLHTCTSVGYHQLPNIGASCRVLLAKYVAGYCIAIDVTARDEQTEAKKKGMPWSIPKGYDSFCPAQLPSLRPIALQRLSLPTL